MVDISPVEGGEASTEIKAFDLGPLLAFHSIIDRQILTRRAWHLRQKNPDFVRFHVCREGSTMFAAGDICREAVPGKMVLIDHSRPCSTRYDHCEYLGLIIPHRLVGYDPSIHPPIIEMDAKTVQGSIVLHCVNTIFENLPILGQGEGRTLAAGLAAFLRSAICDVADEESQGSVREMRSKAMRHFLQRNLENPDLGIETLRRQFGAARATVYRDFEEYGGVTRYVTDRRLARAYQELSDNPTHRGRIANVAQRWHFSSASQFGQLFKKKFGFTPGEAADRHCQAMSTSLPDGKSAPESDAHPYYDVNRWIARLVGAGDRFSEPAARVRRSCR